MLVLTCACQRLLSTSYSSNFVLDGRGYYLYPDDGTGKAESRLFASPHDGHVSYLPHPAGEWVISDTYVIKGYQYLFLYHLPTRQFVPLAKLKSTTPTNVSRVDLHPRLSRSGRVVSIDATHEGLGRQMYIMDIGCILDNPPGKVASTFSKNTEDKPSVPGSLPKEVEPLKVIFDTDMDGDNDDVAAAAILHALADSGKAEILAMGVVSRCPYSPACLDAINTYYGRGDLPIGMYKGTTLVQRGSPYAEKVAERCANEMGLSSEVPDVVGVYRRVLSGQSDSAVTMIAVGQMNNLVDLLASPPDRHSDLSGRDLVQRKVATLFVMAPYFNERNEYQRAYNFVSSPQAARELIAQWPTQIKFGEGNLGHRHFIGSRLRETPAGNPARLAFEAYFAGKKESKRHCADPATVLYAVCGTQYFDEAGPGACEVREGGFTRWNAAGDKQHFHNTQKLPAGELEQVMEQLLITPPKLPSSQGDRPILADHGHDPFATRLLHRGRSSIPWQA